MQFRVLGSLEVLDGGAGDPVADLFPGGCVTSRLHLTMDPNGSSPPELDAGEAP